MFNGNDLIDAWEYWDDLPKGQAEANRKEVVLAWFSLMWDVPQATLHDEMTSLRQKGLSVRQAYQQLSLDYEERQPSHNA